MGSGAGRIPVRVYRKFTILVKMPEFQVLRV